MRAESGKVPRHIHATPADFLDAGAGGTDKVLVQGDLGPDNVLLDPLTCQVTAMADWEFTHFGDPVEDLAWCERDVRTYHPGQANALGHFFSTYAEEVPSWPVREAAMLTRCASAARPGGSASATGSKTAATVPDHQVLVGGGGTAIPSRP